MPVLTLICTSQSLDPTTYPLTREQYAKTLHRPNNFELFDAYEHDAFYAGKSYDWLNEVTRKGVCKTTLSAFRMPTKKAAFT